MDVILSDFRLKMNREDIVIRFYEDFLAAYKPQMRQCRGVYYTPEPVVSYMVRSVDILVKEKFNKPLGLADPEVMILDPACGTGTFLLWICQLIYQRFQESPEALTEGLVDKSWSGYVKERLLPRIFGFELLMAPYAIAHLKLGLFLEETGYQFNGGKRLGIYLTNSLDSTVRKAETLFEEFIAEEADQATEVKRDKLISVVIGNPPYSSISANLRDEVRHIVDPYRYVDNQRIVEKSALQFEKNIQDDYVKFFALSQSYMDRVDRGIVALITNNSFLDSVTLRGMRSSLLDTFKDIYIFDLHGDSDKKEVAHDGSSDKNVFDIKQGVAISLMLKDTDETNGLKACVHSYNYLGSRDIKYQYLSKNSINNTPWMKINNIPPTYLFKQIDIDLAIEYINWKSVTEIFRINSTGFESGKDTVMTAFTQKEMKDKIHRFCTSDADVVKKEFEINEGWGLSLFERRNTILNDPSYEKRVQKFLFNPFDVKYTFYRKDLLKTNSFSAGQHLVYGENISLLVMRQVSMHDGFSHALVSLLMPNNRAFYSKKGKASYFPLYIYSGGDNTIIDSGKLLGTNLNSDFTKELCQQLNLKQLDNGCGNLVTTCGPEDIFNYIYCILHSPNYRARYVDFLKTDFPRIPFTSNKEIFSKLANYGQELVSLHLMKSPKLDNFITKFIENDGNNLVDSGHPKYNQDAVTINKKGDKFTGVPEEVWKFQIGGYQVCQKWLKDRKGRQLSDDDIQHYQRIVVALQQTIKLMDKIDQAIPSFPIQ